MLSTLSSETRSGDITDLMKALAKAQGAFPEIERNRTVRVRPRSGGQEYSFKYATLSKIFEAIRKPLSENGLAYTQIISHDSVSGFYILTTTIYCGNQFIASKTPIIVEGDSNQQFGSALTYMKRYSLAALLGIAADEDDDGNIADGNEIKAMQDKGVKILAPDPISSGPNPAGLSKESRRVLNEAPDNLDTVIAGNAAVLNDLGLFSPALIKVPLLPDESGSDWMTWGQSFIAMARDAPSLASLEKLEQFNAMPLSNMEQQAKRMHTNLKLALLKVRNKLEGK